MASSRESVPHVVVIPLPTQGHVSPLMHLSQALASRGFVITFINTEANQECMKNTLEDGHGLDIRFESVPGIQGTGIDLSHDEGRLIFTQGLINMEGPVEKLLKDKLVSADPPISCLISDMLFRWPEGVARRIGVPNFIFWCASASCILLECSVPQMFEKGDIPVRDLSIDKSITYVRGLSPVPLWGLPCELSFSDDPGFTRRYNRINHVATVSGVLVNSFEELEGSGAFQALREINPNTVAVGPVFLSSLADNASLWKEDTECLTWLNEQKPQSVLYISFGSLGTLDLEQLKEILAGLEELQRPFILAIRPKSVPGMEPEFLKAFKERVISFGLVVSWAPQLKILRHPSTGGYLSHCGWNSILESVSSAVPILCWPCVAEQNLNCKLIVEDWKIGLKFSRVRDPRKVVARDEFVEVVEQLMGAESGDSFRRNVKELSKAAQRAAVKGGSSYESLDKFVKAVEVL
ncbi:hypothetical protein SELMODRAFT_267489 [Selaginella moellendorffii]|uniref:Glycosyltransferase n=1 Tax=Selaginella moellendorffii TaxID=88036 RepID=D8RK29_SELML|nr:hypothetical protein SELMODRAFT_267489 [Selaginella moellendorffii]